MTLSKFHAWNFRFGATKHLWTILKMLLEFRQLHSGDAGEVEKPEGEVENEEGGVDEPAPAQTGDPLIERLTKWQKGANTMTVAISVLADTQLRTLAYMTLSESNLALFSIYSFDHPQKIQHASLECEGKSFD